MLINMSLLKFFILVLLPILLEYGVQTLGVSLDYADPNDFRYSLVAVNDAEKILGENVTGENVTGENVTGENVTGENVTGENVTGENVTSENVTGEKGSVQSNSDANPFTPPPDNAEDPTGRCPFGLFFKKDCNGCWCDPKTGLTICTLKGCGLCLYGTKWKIDCNTCVCDEQTGITRCTRKKCHEGTFSNCVHGTHFKKDCNLCRCSMKTGKTTCTSKKCPKHKLGNKCPNGTNFAPGNEWCDRCHCNPETGETLCTQQYCVPIGDEWKHKIQEMSDKQLDKNKNLKLKIKEAATGCTPPEVILIGNCRCDCRLPSVAVCKESCFSDPVS